MRRQLPRILTWLAIALGGASLFQAFPVTGANGIGGGGCQSFFMTGALSSIDFCAILDCESGFFGGAVQPCGDPSTAADDILSDCTPVADTTDNNN